MVEKSVAASVLLVSETILTTTAKQYAVELPERSACPVEKLGESVRRSGVIAQYYDKALGCTA